jgi:hypothetical protein
MSLRDQLQAIYNERGKLTPTIVVDEARDESHPLQFEEFLKMVRRDLGAA